VFPQRPDGHLVEAGQREKASHGRIGHQREANPGENLVRVIGTRDEVEQPSKRISRGQRNLPDSATRRTEIPEQLMDEEVAGFGEEKANESDLGL